MSELPSSRDLDLSHCRHSAWAAYTLHYEEPVLAEQTDEWAEGRRYLGLDILARSRLCLVSDTGTEVIADTVLQLSA